MLTTFGSEKVRAIHATASEQSEHRGNADRVKSGNTKLDTTLHPMLCRGNGTATRPSQQHNGSSNGCQILLLLVHHVINDLDVFVSDLHACREHNELGMAH